MSRQPVVNSVSVNKFTPNSKQAVTNKQPNTINKPSKPCTGCGAYHWRKECPFRNATCHLCKKQGHIKKMCFRKHFAGSNSKFTSQVHAHAVDSNLSNLHQSTSYDNFIFYSNKTNSNPILVSGQLNSVDVKMELDTGAARSLISTTDYDSLWTKSKKPKILPTTETLRVYGGSPLPVVGEISVQATLGDKSKLRKVKFIVVQGHGPILMGRDIINSFNYLQSNAFNISSESGDDFKSSIASMFPSVFSPGLGCLKEQEFALDVDETVVPKYFRARPVPYSMKAKLDKAYDELLRDDIIAPISYSKWAAPVVPVLKPNGTIRVCGDYKVTVNKAVKLDSYPIPKLEDLFSSLAGGKVFSKLDMSQAYCQLKLQDSSKQYTVINTHRGLFQYNRLSFGISAAPGIFQRAVEQLTQGIPGVLCYLDDILISGATETEHRSRLIEVLKRLSNAGLKLQIEKCNFRAREVYYLDYHIDAEGLHPTADKVKAIVDAPAPSDRKQLESYLGIFNFYRRFIPSASSVLEPLNRLRRANTPWVWSKLQDESFRKSKDLLLNSTVLTHFDPALPITVTTDSSAYGLGAVLSHIINGQERPVCFASRTLNVAERNYPQAEKEALAIVYGLRQFHNYLWGQPKFKVITDHKPLLGLFHPDKPVPPMASGRIQRWALMMQAYSFDLVHKSGAVLGAADSLSRLPLPSVEESIPIPGEWTNLVNFLDYSPLKANTIKEHTRYDPILSKVLKYCEVGWPNALSPNENSLLPYFRKKDELSTEAGCILWGSRVVIPIKDRSSLLNELHGGHVGASRMKELARSYLWWPSLDSELENLVKSCSACLETRSNPPKAELHPWEWPSHPWHRLHIDYAGPVQGKHFLVIVDAHSKWVEIFPSSSPSSNETIKHLRHLFCQHGLPVTVVSDNGTCFTSQEFKAFLDSNGIRHVTTAVYKPATNGLAERMVKTFKAALANSKDSWSVLLDKFLFKYRITPHSSTGVSPAELLCKRKLRCRFDLLYPMEHVGSKVATQQEKQKKHHSSSDRHLNLENSTPVYIRNYARGPNWIPASVEERTGPLSYRCQLDDGRVVKRHQDQIIESGTLLTNTSHSEKDLAGTSNSTLVKPISLSKQSTSSVVTSSDVEPVTEKIVTTELPIEAPTSSSVDVRAPAVIRRSSRQVRPPNRLNL